MKKLLSLMVVVSTIVLFSSCSTGRYCNNSFNLNGTQTQVVLSKANFRIIKNVEATYVYRESWHFSADQLQQSAYAELLKKG